MDLDNNGVVSVEETRAVASEFGAILQSLGQSESRFGTPMKVVESIFKYQVRVLCMCVVCTYCVCVCSCVATNPRSSLCAVLLEHLFR